jgi:hypothetical protein
MNVLLPRAGRKLSAPGYRSVAANTHKIGGVGTAASLPSGDASSMSCRGARRGSAEWIDLMSLSSDPARAERQ